MENPVLKLLTINTWKCDGPYRHRMAFLGQELSRLQPDLIACQEVFRASTANTGDELAERLGMTHQFTPMRYKTRQFEGAPTKSYSGLGLLSRFPVLTTDNLLLPTDERDGERMAQFCLINAPTAEVLVINTHLTHLRNSSVLRIQQLDAILNHPMLRQHAGLAFLCGDFNAELPSAELQFLLNHPAWSVCDTYLTGQGAQPGYTMRPQTEPHLTRGKRIDFIFSITPHAVPQPTISRAQLVLDQPDAAGVYPSDHNGVMIETDLKRP